MSVAKKTAVLGLSAALLLSALPPLALAENSAAPSTAVPAAAPQKTESASPEDLKAAAEAKIGKDQAIELAKKALPLPDGYTLQGVNFNNYGMTGKSGVWNISFVKKDQDRFLGNISAGIDADNGKLLSFYRYDSDPDNRPTYPPKMDFQGAKSKAAELLAAMNPGEKDTALYDDEPEKAFIPPLSGEVRYTIKYDRSVSGVRFPQHFINFTFDGSGNFVGYEFHWDPSVKFDSAAPAIKPDQAEKVYKEKAPVSLQYIMLYNKGGANAEPAISYSLSPLMMDAQAGALLSWNGKEEDKTPDLKPLTAEPLAPKPAANQNLTKEQASTKAASLIGLPANAKLQEASYNENPDNLLDGSSASWNFTWTLPGKTDKQPQTYYNAAINSKTGDLIHYNGDYGQGNEQAASAAVLLTAQDAQQKAVDFIKKILPHYTDQLSMVPPEEDALFFAKTVPQKGYGITFRRLVNGIPSEFENLSVSVSLETGGILNYWGNMSSFRYPEKRPAVIPAEQAKDLLLSQNKLQLVYVLPDEFGKMGFPPNMQADKQQADKTAKLVYRPAPALSAESVFLDAITGKWRKRDTGEETSLEKVKAVDISGHWAQRELQLMLDYKAIDAKDGKVNPDQIITRGELIKILVVSMNGGGYRPMYENSRKASFADVAAGSAYFGYVEQAVDLNILDRTQKDFRPDSKINREEMAVLLVRAMGYNKLAGYKDLFNLQVQDAGDIASKGQVALVTALGIMTASDDGRFNPAQEVTRAQAAAAFYRYLQKKSELQDSMILK